MRQRGRVKSHQQHAEFENLHFTIILFLGNLLESAAAAGSVHRQWQPPNPSHRSTVPKANLVQGLELGHRPLKHFDVRLGIKTSSGQ